MNTRPEIKETPYHPEGPQPLMREIAPGGTYPVDALGPLRPAVEAVQGMTQAPLAIPAASALAVASLAVQGFANVETLGGDRPLSLFVLTIAESGERKTSCDEKLMKALREHERKQAGVQAEAIQTWKNAQALWKGQRENILKAAKQAVDTDASKADLDAIGPEPDAPPSADRTISEPTYEGLTKLFAHGNPSLGLFHDDAGQFLGGHAMNRENRQKTMAAFNKLWQGDPIQRTRAGDGHMTIYGRRLSVHLMVQPIVARTFMADPLAAGTGFLPRFLICEPPSTIGSRFQANIGKDFLGLPGFEARLRDILETEMPMDQRTRELQPRKLRLSAEARDLLVAFSDEIEAAQAPEGAFEAIKGSASKAAEQAARIAGVLTLWRELDAPEVCGEDMANAIQLAKYYLSEALRLASAAIISAEIKKAETLRVWLHKKWTHPEVTVRDLVRHGPSSLRDSPTIREILLMLESHGWLARLDAGTVVRGSARKEAWRIVRATSDTD